MIKMIRRRIGIMKHFFISTMYRLAAWISGVTLIDGEPVKWIEPDQIIRNGEKITFIDWGLEITVKKNECRQHKGVPSLYAIKERVFQEALTSSKRPAKG